MNTQLILVRHTPPAVEPGICYGRLDLPLAATASADIDRCLAMIPTASRIVSSPSTRCLPLAQAVGRRDHVEVQTDARLLELDFGIWEGKLWNQVPQTDIDEWAESLMERAAGGGESLRALWARVQNFADEIVAKGSGNIVVVSHHGPLRALIARSMNQTPDEMFSIFVPWGGVRYVEVAAALSAAQPTSLYI